MNCQNAITYVIGPGDNLYHLAQYYNTTVAAIMAHNAGIDPYNLKNGATITICGGSGEPQRGRAVAPNGIAPAQAELNRQLRKVWEQHVFWTRLLIISIAERLKDEPETQARLLQNPADMAKIFGRYYSPEATKTIEQLMTQHLEIGGKLITALRDGKTVEADALDRLWYVNADQMADVFAAINPYYNRDEVQQMLYSHLDTTTKEVSNRLSGNYAADIADMDATEAEALGMADYFTVGIVRQFPQSFR